MPIGLCPLYIEPDHKLIQDVDGLRTNSLRQPERGVKYLGQEFLNVPSPSAQATASCQAITKIYVFYLVFMHGMKLTALYLHSSWRLPSTTAKFPYWMNISSAGLQPSLKQKSFWVSWQGQVNEPWLLVRGKRLSFGLCFHWTDWAALKPCTLGGTYHCSFPHSSSSPHAPQKPAKHSLTNYIKLYVLFHHKQHIPCL